MAHDNHIKTFTAADIEKYHKGQLSPAERHALEKAALDDPFLADALEGYAVPGVNVADDIAALKRRLAEKTKDDKVIPIGGGRSSFRWLRAAVAILFVAGAGLTAYLLLFDRAPDEIALKSQQETIPATTATEEKAASQLSSTDSLTTPASPGTDAATGTVTLNNVNGNISPASPPAQEIASAEQDKAAIAKDDFTDADTEKNELAKRQPLARAENVKTADTVQKSPGNDNALSKSVAVENQNAKAKEGSAAKKTAPADVKAGVHMNETAPTAATQNRAQQAYGNNEQFKMNFFRGRVTDGYNNALPFANVTNTHDNVGTYTDAKGYFSLVSTDSVLNVQVRSLGFESNNVRLRSDINANQVMMQEDKGLTAKILDTVKRNYTARVRDGNLTFEEPEPADGWLSYDAYLVNNINVPENFDARKSTEGDAVELSFEVNKHGEPVNIRVVKSLCDKCDKEAIRLVKEGPRWKRKAKKGKRTTVKVPFIKPADW